MVAKLKPATKYSSYILAAIFAVIAFILSYTNLLLPLEQLLYDRILRLKPHVTNNEIVIVAMDEKSLQRYGSLPWQRDVHAKLINRLTEADVIAVGYDVLFDKKNHEQQDTALVNAAKKNGKIVFPVIIEKMSQTGELIELMPYPELIQAANKLGLVHFELGDDNISRSTYLRAGLGEAYWRSFAVEVLDVSTSAKYKIPFPMADKKPSHDLTKIEKEALVYIPFKQNPEHFEHVSFVDLVDGKVDAINKIKNKVVFVGVTATAVRNADFLPVPVDRSGQIMPGVEINATLFESLENETYIEKFPRLTNALILALIALLYFSLLPRALPKRSIYYGLSFLILLIFLSWYMLHYWNLWMKVATMLVVLTSGYLLWMWRKMVANMSFFKYTVQRLSFEMKHSMKPNQAVDLKSKIKFLTEIDLLDAKKVKNFNLDEDIDDGDISSLFNKLKKDSPTRKEAHLLRKLTLNPEKGTEEKASSYGVIEYRIKRLQAAIQQMNFLRRFIEQTMDRMNDAIILSDTDGQIFYSNLVAKRYLPQLSLNTNICITELLAMIKLQDNGSWKKHIRKVLQDGINREVTATIDNSLDVKISVSLLDNIAEKNFLVINMVDISGIKREQRRQLEMIDFISHDLRSPMTSILALISRETRNSNDPEANKVYYEIEKLTRSSLTLAEQFLMLSRTEANIELAIYPVELLNAIDNAIAIVTPQANNVNIELNFDFMAYEDIWLRLNQDLLERVITNLLSNAIKYSPENTKVTVAIENTEQSILLKVIDQGDGISTEQMEAIFKPFTRMHKHEMAKVKGIGLGLRFVRAAMLRFGGRVAVESNEGQGSTFILDFPNHLLVEDE